MVVRKLTTKLGTVIAFAAWTVLSACQAGKAVDLPADQVWSSLHFRYHARGADTTRCGDVLVPLEEHFTLLQSILGFDWPSGGVVDYYKFVDAEDFAAHAPCPLGSAGCSFGGKVYTAAWFEQHELVHAYLWPRGSPPVVLVEGVAVALSCSHHLPQAPTLSLEQALNVEQALSDTRVYETGGRFVRYLMDRYAERSFFQVYSSLSQDAKLSDLDGILRSTYGVGVDELWLDMLVTQPSCAPPFACSREALPVDGTPVPVAPLCGHGIDYRTFSMASSGNVAVTGPAGSHMGRCAPVHAYETLATSFSPGTSQVGLLQVDAGPYYLSFDPEQTTSVSVEAAETPWAGPACEVLRPYVIGSDDYPALSVTLPEKPKVWFLQLRFDGPHRLSLSHNPSGLDESVEVTVCPDCDFYSPGCRSANLAREDLDVVWNGSYFLRFNTLAAVAPNRIDLVCK
jgi:hypothetical protein